MTLLRAPLDIVLRQIEQQRAVVDARLTSPARWRGPLRKPSHRSRRRRVARAFDRLVAQAGRGDGAPLQVDDLLRLHRSVAGGGGFRTGGARVGGIRVPHSVAAIPPAVETALARAADGTEPAPLAAARLHLELLLIHPFSDGNGRVARLAAAWVLLCAGFHSTLFTAVEQHPRGQRAEYARGFARLRGGLDAQGPWLRMALGQMAAASAHAAAFRRRENQMRAALAASGFPGREHDDLLVSHDFDGGDVPPLAGFDRWSEGSADLPPQARFQIRRLLAEERAPWEFQPGGRPP